MFNSDSPRVANMVLIVAMLSNDDWYIKGPFLHPITWSEHVSISINQSIVLECIMPQRH